MNRNNLAKLATALVFSLIVTITNAAVPNTINYQGFLTDATTGQPQNATVSVTFKLYDALTAGNLLYTETQSVTPTNGTFNVQIGSVVGTPLFNTLVFDKPCWLEITLGTQTLSPRQPLASSATALRAKVADSLAPVPGTGASNVALGEGALQAATNSFSDTATGFHALYSNTTGWYNTAIGESALFTNNAGAYNTATGASALYSNINGSENTASGYAALSSNTIGYENIANGSNALQSNTTGYKNTASGFAAMNNNTTASHNVALGFDALISQSFSNGGAAWDSYNTAVGSQALFSNQPTGTTNAVFNTAVGGKALYSNTTGTYNTANGASALQNNNIGNWNTAVGYSALLNNSNGSSNSAFGSNVLAGNTSGTGNVAVGDGSMYVNATGNNNTALGQFALKNSVSGSSNIAIGYSSGTNLSTGNNNIDIGNTGSPADTGIIRIGTAGTHSATYIAGALYNPSDRNLKENFASVNAQEVLIKVASLPLQVWNYKQDNPNTRHIGPMAQDFSAAFSVGADDKHIATVDESGVALAAIKGLYQQLLAEKQGNKAKAKKISNLERELATIKAKLGLK
jgi:hypothetical protein